MKPQIEFKKYKGKMTPERRVNKSSVEKQKFRGTKFRAEESLFVPTDQGRLSDGTASFTLHLKY
jgi:hypothetical protein